MILCVGTTPTMQRTMMFANLRIDAVNRAKAVIESASGKSINVARVLATLGEPCTATGFLGGDTGQFIRHDLDHAGISHDFVEVRAHTRTCTTIIDEATSGVTELIEESKSAEPAAAWDRLREKIEALLETARMVVLSGSLTPDAPRDFYAWCIERASHRSIRTIVDASAEPLALAIARRPFVIKPNRTELAQALGIEIERDRDLRHAMTQAANMGAQWVVVTLGREGSVISDGEKFWEIHGAPIEAVSAIGSGDSYAAGLAAALVRGQSLPEAATLGAACAAANAMIPIAGYLRPEDIERVLAQTRLLADR